MWLLISATNFCTDIVKSSPHTSAGPSGARRRRIPSSATNCGCCVGCNGSRIPSRRSCSTASAAHPSVQPALPGCWSALRRLPGLASSSSAHAAARLWLRLGQQRPRYQGAASLPRPSQHPAHGAIYRVVAGQVQGLLALTDMAGLDTGSTRWRDL